MMSIKDGVSDVLNDIVTPLPQSLKSRMPNRVKKAFRDNFYKDHDDARRIQQFKDIHRNQRCFIIGTGPSLIKTNLSLLQDEITFGVNTLYKGFGEIGIDEVSYYSLSDRNVWKMNYQEILDLNCPLFLSGAAGREYLLHQQRYDQAADDPPIILKDLGELVLHGWKVKDIEQGTYYGNSVVIDNCLQVAYYMGFSEVYLLGCDCSYKGAHHFDGEEYDFQFKSKKEEKQFKEDVKHWSYVFQAYEILRDGFKKDGRMVYNATPGGDLEVFERRSLEDVFNEK